MRQGLVVFLFTTKETEAKKLMSFSQKTQLISNRAMLIQLDLQCTRKFHVSVFLLTQLPLHGMSFHVTFPFPYFPLFYLLCISRHNSHVIYCMISSPILLFMSYYVLSSLLQQPLVLREQRLWKQTDLQFSTFGFVWLQASYSTYQSHIFLRN